MGVFSFSEKPINTRGRYNGSRGDIQGKFPTFFLLSLLFFTILLSAQQYGKIGMFSEIGVSDIRTGDEQAKHTVDYVINPKVTKVPVDEIREGDDYETTKGENQKYTITLTDSEDKKHEIVTDKFPTTIKDASGAVYEVDKDGNIKQISSKSDVVLNDATKYKKILLLLLYSRK